MKRMVLSIVAVAVCAMMVSSHAEAKVCKDGKWRHLKCGQEATGPVLNDCAYYEWRWDRCIPKKPRKIVLSGIHFDFDSAEIRPISYPILDKDVELLKSAPKTKIRIVGYTCNMGTEEYNDTLSLERANSVRDYFVSKGIDGSRITTEGRGERNPIADNDTREGRVQNRRIEIELSH